jgi:hypothetical protein
MIRAISLSFLLLSAAACAPTLEPVAHEASLCDAVAPDWSAWDGTPLQLPDESAIYVCKKPLDPKSLLAIVTTFDEVKLRFDIAPQQIPLFLQTALGFSAGAPQTGARGGAPAGSPGAPNATVESIRCKGTTTTPPMTRFGEPGSEPDGEVDPDNAAYFIYRTRAIRAARELADADFASGKVCPPKALQP